MEVCADNYFTIFKFYLDEKLTSIIDFIGTFTSGFRRRSSVNFTKKKKKKKKKNPSIFGSLTSFSSSNSKGSRSKEDSGDEIANRIISFGNMPSYRYVYRSYYCVFQLKSPCSVYGVWDQS